jgi:predicted aspartyl protease
MRTSEETLHRFEAEQAAYWRMREHLLEEHKGEWVAVVNGQVVSTGKDASDVLLEAVRKTGCEVGFTARVGYEDAVRWIRRVLTGHYDADHHPPMPVVTTEVGDWSAKHSTEAEFVVDTGSDGTALRAEVADQLGLWNRVCGVARVRGIGGAAEVRRLYGAIVRLGGKHVAVRADCRDDLDENLLGRDVINGFALTICAKRDEVRFEWVDGSDA